MKTLYYLSHIPSGLFYCIAWLCYGTSWCFSVIGDWLHDELTYRLWLKCR